MKDNIKNLPVIYHSKYIKEIGQDRFSKMLETMQNSNISLPNGLSMKYCATEKHYWILAPS
jgi:hypothetical protein